MRLPGLYVVQNIVDHSYDRVVRLCVLSVAKLIF